MNKLSSIPIVDKPSALIDLVANSKLYKERMEKLLSYQENLNSQISRQNDIQDLIEYKNKVQGREQRVKAAEYKSHESAKAIKAEADKYTAEAEAHIVVVTSDLRSVRLTLEHKESNLQKLETALKYRESEVGKQKIDLAKLIRVTEATRLEADEALHKYEAKLAAINALAKE